MNGELALPLRSLREKVYEHLKIELNEGRLVQGSFLNLDEICNALGISRTPLRDALFQLESEGFVTILPRRGVLVNVLTLEKIRNIYQIVGALEGSAITAVAVKLRPEDIDKMERLVQEMREALLDDDYDAFYDRNLAFHAVCLNLCDNEDLRRLVRVLRDRLYDFPRNKGFIKEWELKSTEEHGEFVQTLRRGDFDGAATYMREVHWAFAVQERFIRKYYFAHIAELDRKKGV